jgi:hypothetical protein
VTQGRCRQATGLGEAAEERARRRRSGGGRGVSDSGEWVTMFDQHAARGDVVVHREGLRLMGARGKQLGHGAHRAAAMADGGGSGGNARARRERPGRVYMGAEGRLGGHGVNHVVGARAAWAARRGDVRRRGGQWRVAVGTPASGS